MQQYSTPVLWTVGELANKTGISKAQGYAIIPLLPEEAVIRIGRRIRLNAEIVTEWLKNGGTR